MAEIVRAALVQQRWTGDKESMIAAAVNHIQTAASAGARIVFNPSATSRGLSQYLWRLEQPASAVANEYFVGAINRVGVEPLGDNDFYGQTYFADPRGQLLGEAAADDKDEVLVRDLDMAQLTEVRDLWQFYRDRRPDAYGPLVQP